jgi:ribosome-binding protein aMBF1 (putative translation factor)
MHLQANSGPGDRQSYRRAVGRRFGRHVAEARQQAGISQQALADIAAISRDEVARFERGAVCPRLDTALRVSASLDNDPLRFLSAVVVAVQADG